MNVKSPETVLKLLELQIRLLFQFSSANPSICGQVKTFGNPSVESQERFSPQRAAGNDGTSRNGRQTAKIPTVGFSLIVLLVFLMLFPCSSAGGQEPAVFSNKDLENYMLTTDKVSGTGTSKSETPEEAEIKRKARAIQEQDEQEYWCKKASTAAKQVEKSKERVKDSENALSESTNSLLTGGGRKRKSIEKEIKKIEQTLKMDRTRLKEREEDLAEIQGEAHRKGVPPGWLRCQFE